MEKNNKFEYTYTAPTEQERREINSIRKDYLSPDKSEDSKLNRLRKLDKRVKSTALYIALIIGIVGTLIFGWGLTLALEWNNFIVGIIVSAIGLIPVISAYPVHKYVLKINKNKYAKEILHLSEEILNETEK